MAGPVSVFVIWEPVLGSDFLPPSAATLSLLHDGRAWQLWDRHHLLSDAMREAMIKHPSSISIAQMRTGRKESGILWDAVALFQPGTHWDETLPPPIYLDGDVVDVVGELEKRIEQMLHGENTKR